MAVVVNIELQYSKCGDVVVMCERVDNFGKPDDCGRIGGQSEDNTEV